MSTASFKMHVINHIDHALSSNYTLTIKPPQCVASYMTYLNRGQEFNASYILVIIINNAYGQLDKLNS